MTEPCLNRRGSLFGSSFYLPAVRGPLGFTSCPKNVIYRKWGLFQIRGSSNLTNRPTVVKESSETRYVCKSAWTLQGEGVAMVHSVPWVCMSNVWGPQCMGAGMLLPLKTDLSKTNHPRPTLVEARQT